MADEQRDGVHVEQHGDESTANIAPEQDTGSTEDLEQGEAPADESSE